MPAERVLIVGTTADYIQDIHQRFPGRALFLTDFEERARTLRPSPDAASEVLCALSRPRDAMRRLREHVERHPMVLSGVACFDCESLGLASVIARVLRLPYPSRAAVSACRSKFVSKQLWARAGVPSPRIRLARTADEAATIMRGFQGRRVVLKPLTGSGSELLFACTDPAQCAEAFEIAAKRLARHENARMYASYRDHDRLVDPRTTLAVEEIVEGQEFSCDFILDAQQVDIVRVARKIPSRDLGFGVTLAYVVPAVTDGKTVLEGTDLDVASLARQLAHAARTLGLDRAICTADFIVDKGRVFILEIAPRLGGDCLLPLVLQGCGLDLVGLALDFSQRLPIRVPSLDDWSRRVGVRYLSRCAGVLRAIDDRAVRRDARVIESEIYHEPGHRVVLPPQDYDSRILGHAIFAPTSADRIEDECHEIADMLRFEWDGEGTSRPS